MGAKQRKNFQSLHLAFCQHLPFEKKEKMVKYVVIDKFMKMLDINSYQRDVSISQVPLLTNITSHGSDNVCKVFEK